MRQLSDPLTADDIKWLESWNRPIPEGYDVADGAEEEAAGYSGWTVKRLKAEIKSRNEQYGEEDQMPVSGTKDELVQLLEDDDNDAGGDNSGHDGEDE